MISGFTVPMMETDYDNTKTWVMVTYRFDPAKMEWEHNGDTGEFSAVSSVYVPSASEVMGRWYSYCDYAAENFTDPLNVLGIPSTVTAPADLGMMFVQDSDGVRLAQVLERWYWRLPSVSMDGLYLDHVGVRPDWFVYDADGCLVDSIDDFHCYALACAEVTEIVAVDDHHIMLTVRLNVTTQRSVYAIRRDIHRTAKAMMNNCK